jgi:hypothetical protein
MRKVSKATGCAVHAYRTPRQSRPLDGDEVMAEFECGLGNWGPKWADLGQCHYCGKSAAVKPEPFGDQDACQQCWEQICWGE